MSLAQIERAVSACTDCTRLRKHCQKIALEKRRAYLGDSYWGKPISGFGAPDPRLIVVGLAPAAHGANRTGRVFTGDRSGEWLYRALHKAGFANQPTSQHREDGLRLNNAYVTCVVKCAPPDNRPAPKELAHCQEKFFAKEILAVKNATVFIALGQIAYHGLWYILDGPSPRPPFGHGKEIQVQKETLLLSYHPSQQNTFTKRLTEPMFDSVFSRAKELLTT